MRRVGPHYACADGRPGHPLDRARVLTRNGNYSAFSGYHFTPSDYSALLCLDCGARWRSAAAYVVRIPDATSEEGA